MARKVRVEYPGAIYHVMNRGDRRGLQRDPTKVALAQRLRGEIMVTVAWIAQRLAMGTPGYMHHLMYQTRKHNLI